MSAEPQIKIYQDDITPFLQRLPAFLLFPFKPAPLIMIAGLSALSVVTVFAFGMFRGLLMLFFLRYAYAVMEMASMGQLNPKWDDITVWGNKDKRPYKQNLVFLLYFLLMVVVGTYAMKPDANAPAISSKSQTSAASVQMPAAASLAAIAGNEASPARRPAPTDEDDDSADPDEPKALSQYDMATPKASNDGSDEAARRIAMREAELTYGKQNGAQDNSVEESSNQPRSRMDKFMAPDVHFAKWFYVLAILFALPIPAAVMVLAIEDNAWRALNPATALFFIRGMGASYFVVWAIFGAVLLSIEGLRHLIPATWSPFVSVPLMTFLNFYLILATYSMMGYVLYQYHQQLGLPVAVDFDTHREQSKAQDNPAPASSDPFIQRIDALLMRGELDAALRILEDEMRYERGNLTLNEKLYQLLLRKGDEKRICEQARRYMLVLGKAGYHEKAMHMLGELKNRDPAFEVQPDDILQVASSAFATNDFKGAMNLIQGFDKKNPKHADIPAVYMLAARLSGDHFRKYAQAISIVKVILQRYPDADVAAEASVYLEKMQKLMAALPPAAPVTSS
ncbi:tetratricopeptide repeat protein [Undibacterium sp. TC4M20W]|uniref:tetratricopeptide repeat protein n=1 Tax=Undibacterium sp. TC4M20W TaxID=3413052 RepID=UPI003BF2E9DE